MSFGRSRIYHASSLDFDVRSLDPSTAIALSGFTRNFRNERVSRYPERASEDESLRATSEACSESHSALALQC